jgi:hypothetical protein
MIWKVLLKMLCLKALKNKISYLGPVDGRFSNDPAFFKTLDIWYLSYR